MRIPKITLPEFSGKFEDWLSFHDLFVSLVHDNKHLSGTHKMCYMRSSLKGEALKVIDTFPTCDASYEPAWEMLKKWFNNKYVLTKQHVNAIINWPKLRNKGTKGIHNLVDGFERHTKLLSQLGEDASGYGMLLTQLLVSKLDEETKHDWEVQVEATGKHSISELYDFLHSQTRILDAAAADYRLTGRHPQRRLVANVLASNSPIVCENCNEAHHLWRCDAFQLLTLEERASFVRARKLCNNCLSPGHWAKTFKSRFRCTHCSGKHHTLMHGNLKLEQSIQPQDRRFDGQHEVTNLTAISIPVAKANQVLLSTAIIKVKSANGQWIFVKALLDNGAQVNLMTEALCERLGLAKNINGMRLFGVGRRSVSASAVCTSIAARNEKYEQQMDFVLMPRITGYQPSVDVAAIRTNLP